MFSKTNCLKKKKDFEKVFKKGKGFKEDFLALKITKNELGQSRFGIIVSQKISKKAAVRNKVKRKIREILKRKLPRLKKEVDVVLIAISGLEKKDFWEIEKTIDSLFKKARII